MSETQQTFYDEQELLKDIEQLDRRLCDDPASNPDLMTQLLQRIELYQKIFPDKREGIVLCLEILSHSFQRDWQPEQLETLDALLAGFASIDADEPAVYRRCAFCCAKLALLLNGSERQVCLDRLDEIATKHSEDPLVVRTYLDLLTTLLKRSNRSEAEWIHDVLLAFYERDPNNDRCAEAYAKALVSRSYFQNLRQDQSSVQKLEQLHHQFPLYEEIALSYAKGLYNLTSDLKLTEYRLPLYHLSTLQERFPWHEDIAAEYAQGLANLIVDLFDNENEIYLALLDQLRNQYPDNSRITKAYAKSLAHCLRVFADETKLPPMQQLLDTCRPRIQEQEYAEVFFKGLAGLTGSVRKEFLCSASTALAEFYAAHSDDVNARLAYLESLLHVRWGSEHEPASFVTADALRKLFISIRDDERYADQLLETLDQHTSAEDAYRHFAPIVAFPSQRGVPDSLPVKSDVGDEFKTAKDQSIAAFPSLHAAEPGKASDAEADSHDVAQTAEESEAAQTDTAIAAHIVSHPEKRSAAEQNAERDLQLLQAQSYAAHMKKARQRSEHSVALHDKVVAGKQNAATKPLQGAPEQIHRVEAIEVPYSTVKASHSTDHDIAKISKVEPAAASLSFEALEESLNLDPDNEQLRIDYAKALLNLSYQQEQSAAARAKLGALAAQDEAPDDVLHAYASSLLHQIQQERNRDAEIPPPSLPQLDLLVQQHPGKSWLAFLYAKDLVNQSTHSDLGHDDSFVATVEALHFRYPDDLDITIAYARILHNLSVDEKLSLDSPTMSKLQLLAEQHPHTFAITISYAKGLANLSYDVPLDIDNDIIPRLRQLYEAHADNEDFAFRYARGLLHLSHDINVSRHTQIIDDLRVLAEAFPYSVRIVMEYATGLYNLVHDQSVSDAEDTLLSMEALAEQYRHHPTVACVYAEAIAGLCRRMDAEKTLGAIRRLEQLLLDYKYDKRIFSHLCFALYACAHRQSLDELRIFQEIIQHLHAVFSANKEFVVIAACIDLLIFCSQNQEDTFGWYDPLKNRLNRHDPSEHADCLDALRDRLETLQEELDETRSHVLAKHILPHFSQLQAELELATELQ